VTRGERARHRTDPLRVPLCRNVPLTPRGAAKEVRQFGFDISAQDISYSVGDALGVCVDNDTAVVDAWLAATGLAGDEPVEVDGAHVALRDALITSYDISPATPNLLSIVAGRCPDRTLARMLRAPRTTLANWLVGSQRARHRRRVRGARRPGRVAGRAGAAVAAAVLDRVEPAGQSARDTADCVRGALPECARGNPARGVFDVPGRPGPQRPGVRSAFGALPATR
jgi:hypothetical protein